MSTLARRKSRNAPAADAPRPSPGPGRPKDPEKRAAILEAAKKLFPFNGFEGTSMDAIAAEAGVSKLTVYSHFQDKETLFREVLKAKCAEQLPDRLFEVNRDAPLRDQLTAIARGFFALVVSPEAMAIHRMMCANPSEKLGTLFWQAGPQVISDHMEHFLRAEIAEGALEIPDTHRAAKQFFCLLKGEPHARLSYGCACPMTPKEVDAHVASVVEVFLRAYAPR
jgi:TetR/AcrR family transcriptional repressor of mexJK operon